MQESEIIEDRTRAYEVMDQGAYFARIFNPRMLSIVANDVLAKKVYPLVIDKKTVDPMADYRIKMPNIYIDKKAMIHVSTQATNNVAIAQGTEIGSNCYIQ